VSDIDGHRGHTPLDEDDALENTGRRSSANVVGGGT
jgi:hypothetical protein